MFHVVDGKIVLDYTEFDPNDFHELNKQLVDIYYKKSYEGYPIQLSLSDIDALLDTCTILPFPIVTHSSVAKFVNMYFSTYELQDNRTLLRGDFRGDSYQFIARSKTYLHDLEHIYATVYACTYCSDSTLIILSYTEHDITCSIYETEEEYRKGVQSTIDWYNEYY